jgi:hypothetical protein
MLALFAMSGTLDVLVYTKKNRGCLQLTSVRHATTNPITHADGADNCTKLLPELTQ